MIKIVLSLFFSLMFNTLAVSGMASFTPHSVINVTDGTLSITVDATPAPGLPAPQILVMRGYIIIDQKAVNWGSTWNLVVPSGNYKIFPLPVSDGTDFYLSNTLFPYVPPNTTVNSFVTYYLS